MSPIKVAHVASVDMSLRYLLLNQMRSLQQVGYELAGISSPGPEVPGIEAVGIHHIAVPITRRYTPLIDLIALWRLYRIMRQERFSIVHTHTPKGALLGQYAALLARVPIRIHTIHGLYFPGHMHPKMRWLYVLLERITMFFSQMNLSQSPEDIPVAIEEGICAPDRIKLLGNGIDITVLDPSLQTVEKRLATRAKLGLHANHKVVGMVGRFVAEKGYREMLQAAQIIKRTAPEVRFIFIGPIEPDKKDGLVPGIISDMELDDVVQFLGHRTDMPDLYAIMDVFALPSHREGFPRAPMEAAAMGVPAVVTNIRGCRETVADKVTGYLIPVRNPEALATALLDLLYDDAKRFAFGQAARAKAVAEFDEQLVFDKVKAEYARLLREKGLPVPEPRLVPAEIPS